MTCRSACLGIEGLQMTSGHTVQAARSSDEPVRVGRVPRGSGRESPDLERILACCVKELDAHRSFDRLHAIDIH